MHLEQKPEFFSQNKSFLGVAYAFFIIMLGTTMPTPLYPIYSETFGLTHFMITVIYAVYAFGVIFGLLVFGQLSDRIGRRYILIPGVIISALSALIFLSANGITFLFVGRILSGLSAGLFTSTATATLVNLAPTYKQGKASMIASGVNMLGLGAGPLLAGFLAQYFFFPLRVVFIVNLILLIPACVFLWKMPEPIQKLKSFRISVQKLSVPKQVRSTFIRAVIPAFVGFSILGLFTAVSPSFIQEVWHIQDYFVLGLIVFSIFCMSAIGQLLLLNTENQKVLTLGSLILIIGIASVALSLYIQSLSLLIFAGLISGLGQAFSFRSGLASVNAATASEKRGEVTSSFFTIAYIALSIPVIGVGLMAKWSDIQVAGIVFSIAITLLAIIAFLLLIFRSNKNKQ